MLADEKLEVIQVFVTKGPGLERSSGFGRMEDKILGEEVELPCFLDVSFSNFSFLPFSPSKSLLSLKDPP